MARKAFVIFLSIQAFIFLFAFAIKYYQPQATGSTNIKEFPLEKGGWVGQHDDLIPQIVEMLNPTEIFSATYTNRKGTEIHLFFDYFARQSSLGGPHSPRNCMPGSGWIIYNEGKNEIRINGRNISTGRFDLRLGQSKKVMDFWYITRYGETASDYVFKLYTMISSLTFRPNDIVFVRVLAEGDEEDLEDLKEFEELFVKEIYSHLGFK
jgi:EpsI family protein